MSTRRRAHLRAAAALALLVAGHLPSVALAQTRYVCGADYNDASLRCTVNPTCPTGDGCPGDQPVCFALERANCFSPPPTGMPTTGTPTGSAKPTPAPTPAPRQVCGLTYNAALAGCLTNTACFRGDGCVAGEACFNIPFSMCVSDAPTAAPTPAPRVCGRNVADAEGHCPDPARACAAGCGQGEACWTVAADRCGATAAPSPGPTLRPTDPLVPRVCGRDAADAEVNCPDAGQRCPTGTECGRGQACFTVTEDRCGGGPTFATPDQPAGPTPQTQPTSWLADLGVTGAPTRHVHVRYCGLSLQDAHDRCAVNVPCPDGRSDNCATGQTCFPVPLACMDSVFPDPPTAPDGVTSPAGAVTPSPVTPPPTVEPTAPPPPTDKPVYDPTATQFCGADYNDALDNCYRQRPCPNGTPEECPKGQGCYPGITNCQTLPPSTPAPMAPPVQEPAANLSGGGPGSAPAPTVPPTTKPTSEIPGWDWVSSPSSCSHRMGSFLQSVVVGGAILGPILTL